MTALYIEEYGKGEPLVLVHGWAMHSGVWGDFAKNLAKQFRVICVDLPGHGRSPAGSFVLDQIVDELSLITPKIPCCWLGWSMGATIVQEMARKYPERVDSLILMAGSPCFVKKKQWPGIRVQLLDSFSQFLVIQPGATLSRFMALQVLGEPDSKSLLKNLKDTLLRYPTPESTTLLMGIEILKETDLRQEFAGLNIPVLVCLGENDNLVPVAVEQSILQLLPGTEIMIVKDAGHLLFLTHVQEVINGISAFVGNH